MIAFGDSGIVVDVSAFVLNGYAVFADACGGDGINKRPNALLDSFIINAGLGKGNIDGAIFNKADGGVGASVNNGHVEFRAPCFVSVVASPAELNLVCAAACYSGNVDVNVANVNAFFALKCHPFFINTNFIVISEIVLIAYVFKLDVFGEVYLCLYLVKNILAQCIVIDAEVIVEPCVGGYRGNVGQCLTAEEGDFAGFFGFIPKKTSVMVGELYGICLIFFYWFTCKIAFEFMASLLLLLNIYFALII